MSRFYFNSKNDFIFMRLANAETNEGLMLDGNQTICEYQKYINKNGSVWYGTDSLYYGISKNKLKVINECLDNAGSIKVVFVISNRGNGDNRIAFTGEIVEVVSSRERTQRVHDVPSCFIGNKHKTWIRLSCIEKENELMTENLKVKSTNNILARAIEGSRYQMGYLTRI